MTDRIILGATAGHHFHGPGDLQVVRHCRRGDQHGFLMTRKRLVDRKAFDYDPTLGWSIDRWFEWAECDE